MGHSYYSLHLLVVRLLSPTERWGYCPSQEDTASFISGRLLPAWSFLEAGQWEHPSFTNWFTPHCQHLKFDLSSLLPKAFCKIPRAPFESESSFLGAQGFLLSCVDLFAVVLWGEKKETKKSKQTKNPYVYRDCLSSSCLFPGFSCARWSKGHMGIDCHWGRVNTRLHNTGWAAGHRPHSHAPSVWAVEPWTKYLLVLDFVSSWVGWGWASHSLHHSGSSGREEESLGFLWANEWFLL